MKTHNQNLTTTNHNHSNPRNRCYLWFNSSASSVAKNLNPVHPIYPVILSKIFFFSSFVLFFTSWFKIISNFIQNSKSNLQNYLLPHLAHLNISPNVSAQRKRQKWQETASRKTGECLSKPYQKLSKVTQKRSTS